MGARCQPQAAVRTRPATAAVIYAAALFQGLTLVSFPALSGVLTRSYGLSDAQYGAIYLPQLAFAALGALCSGLLAGNVGLGRMQAAAVAALAASQAALALLIIAPMAWTLPIILLGTAAVGLGAGLSAAPMNTAPRLLFPQRSHGAVVAAHTLVGIGLAAGPALAASLIDRDAWGVYPATLGVAGLVLLAAASAIRLPTEVADHDSAATVTEGPLRHPLFWAFATLSVLYALAEGTFSNWAVLYVGQARGLSELAASLALSAFWGALVAGRLAVSLTVGRIVSPVPVWVLLPGVMAFAFLLIPHAPNAAALVGLFALAGLGCSACFPLTVTLASHAFPQHVAWVSSLLIAALMIGIGAGSFAVGALHLEVPFTRIYTLSAGGPALMMVIAVWISRTGALAEPVPAADPPTGVGRR